MRSTRRDLAEPQPHTPPALQPDVLSDLDATVLYQARHDISVPADQDGPWAHAVAGLIDAGLLTVTTNGDTVLADDLRYSLRGIDTDDVNPY
ncbi:hypothetical protein ACFWAR_19500 [Streptomyces sp. NPDC059917]|uniref:hypothetical protein n=1 Tax=Streptomyces sp. NPDC059917 TaxID=3347002 RepID=UPI00364E8F39